MLLTVDKRTPATSSNLRDFPGLAIGLATFARSYRLRILGVNRKTDPFNRHGARENGQA